MLLKPFHKIGRKGTLPNPFYKSGITSIPKLHPYVRKLYTNFLDEHSHKRVLDKIFPN
jgi:hypothetical protein